MMHAFFMHAFFNNSADTLSMPRLTVAGHGWEWRVCKDVQPDPLGELSLNVATPSNSPPKADPTCVPMFPIGAAREVVLNWPNQKGGFAGSCRPMTKLQVTR